MIRCACVAIGVSDYCDTNLQALPGAVEDAKNFFQAATDEVTGICDKEISSLLLNPTRQTAREEIARLVYSPSITNITIYFAGHGAEAKSGYYLACKDSESTKLALTGLSLTDVFQLLNENNRFHANVVIDACQNPSFSSP